MIELTRLAFRDALAQLRREPVAAAFVSLTIATGVAASAAIFTVARGVVLRPLPYHDASSLVAIQEYQPERRLDPGGIAFANLPRYRALPAVESITAFSYAEAVLSGDGDAERVIAANVDSDLLPTLGVRPELGRGIEATDMTDSPVHVVVLGNALWRRRYGGDRSLVGRSVAIDGDAYTVVGIMPAGFEFPRNPAMDRDVSVWMPRRPPPPMMMRRGMRDLTTIVRLRPGLTLAALQTQLVAGSTAARQDDLPLNNGWRTRALGLRELVVGRVAPAIVQLSACVAMLLLIAGANTSAAMLARTTARRSAYGIRLALGASNGRLVGLLVAESMLVGLAALIIGMPLSVVARAALVRIAPVAIPRQGGIAWTGATTAFAIGIALCTALVSVAASALWLRRMDIKQFLADSRTVSGSRGRTLALASFVVAQAGLGTMLLGATLAIYARYARLNAVQPGFETAGVTTATIPMRGMRYRSASARWNLTNQLLARVRARPGVQSAAVASLMPLSGGLMSAPYKARDIETDSAATAMLRAVSPSFFQTLGIQLRQGRAIGPTDGPQAPAIAVVNEAFVRQALATQMPIGRVLTLTPPGADEPLDFTIVGVVANAKELDLASPDSPIIYLSDAQASFPHTVLAVKSLGAPPLDAVRRTLHDLDSSLALDDVGPLVAKVRATYALQYFQLTVLSMFAISALLLIAVGIYGAVTFVAVSDKHATAIRLALGASPRQIAYQLLRRTARWSLAGCTLGVLLLVALRPMLGLAWSAAHAAGALAAAGMVIAVALGATGLPSMRASTMNAVSVINAE